MFRYLFNYHHVIWTLSYMAVQGLILSFQLRRIFYCPMSPPDGFYAILIPLFLLGATPIGILVLLIRVTFDWGNARSILQTTDEYVSAKRKVTNNRTDRKKARAQKRGVPYIPYGFWYKILLKFYQ